MEKTPKLLQNIYNCIECDFKCSKNSDWLRHIARPKHLYNVEKTPKTPKTAKTAKTIEESHNCKSCGSLYKYKSGLWKHKKNCIPIQETKNTLLETDEFQNLTNVILDLVKSNADLQKQMLNICKNGNNAHKVDLDSPTPLMS